MLHWTNWGASTLAAFLASFVEGVEALTIVLAVGVTRGWRSALIGVAAALVALIVAVALFGPMLTRFPIPLAWLQLALGLFLLGFGMKWLQKAVLRAAGRIPLHDEARIYERQARQFAAATPAPRGLDPVSFAACFKAVLVEGMEVVLIVVAVGAGQASFVPSGVGAMAALLPVVALGILLHRPLTRVPENGLKFGVGVLLSAFGVFWIGEGGGAHWPGGDLAILSLAAAIFAAALLAVRIAKAPNAP